MLEYKTKYFKFNGISIKAKEYGIGPPVILVHGWPETYYSWRHQIKPIAKKGFKVIAINMRGYDGSYSPLKIEKYDMLSMVSDIVNIIKTQNYDTAILIGHDWGAPICWNTAALHPDKVSAVLGLSVPFTRRGSLSSTELWRKIYKNIFFYQTYFQKVGIPERELERNIEDSLRKIYFWCSAEGYDSKVQTSKEINSGLLDGLINPRIFPKWLSDKDINIFVESFKSSGFHGPLNRYRNQDRDWEKIPQLSDLTIDVPSYFIAGSKDPVRFFIKDKDAYDNPGKYCTKFHGKLIIDNAGHWVQQEKPEQTNIGILSFLDLLSSSKILEK